MLAGNGFVVAVPEVYINWSRLAWCWRMTRKGRTEAMPTSTPKPLAYDSDTRAVFDYLQTLYCTGELGTMGICLGGHVLSGGHAA